MDTSQYWDYASYAVFFFSNKEMFQIKKDLKFEVRTSRYPCRCSVCYSCRYLCTAMNCSSIAGSRIISSNSQT